jgi:hypothetical protein
MDDSNIEIPKSKIIFYKENEEFNKMIHLVVPDANINISIFDLINLVINNKIDDNKIVDSDFINVNRIVIQDLDFINVNGKIKYIDEPEDEFLDLNDLDLIDSAQQLLNDAKQFNIEGFYNQFNHKRRFNLSGLYSVKNGIKSNKQRYLIRDLCRLCKQYLNSNYVSNLKELM